MPEDMNCPGKEMRCNLVEENLREKSLQRSRFQRGPSLDAANHCEQTRPQANACFWKGKFGGIGIGQATSEAVSWLKMDMRRGSGNSSQPPIVEVQLSSLHSLSFGLTCALSSRGIWNLLSDQILLPESMFLYVLSQMCMFGKFLQLMQIRQIMSCSKSPW